MKKIIGMVLFLTGTIFSSFAGDAAVFVDGGFSKDGKVYDFLSDGNASYTGKMDEDGIEITRVYQKLNGYKVLVNYYTSTNGKDYLKDN